MMGVTKRVSVSLSLALIIGWGALALFLIQARITTAATDTLQQPSTIITPSIRLRFQVDKSIYRANDTVLLALRNDSRKPIWLSQQADGCTDSWWQVQQLQGDGETWQAVPRSKQTCSVKHFGQQAFARHTIMTGQWLAVIPGPALGNVMIGAPSGTYRFAAPYVAGVPTPTEADWSAPTRPQVVSPVFTIQ